MKERPILFSAPMVRAILAGTKTQTRRVVVNPGYSSRVWRAALPHPQGDGGHRIFGDDPYLRVAYDEKRDRCGTRIRCPYGVVGDRLWVKETWGVVNSLDDRKPNEIPVGLPIIYRASSVCPENGSMLWRPSLFMKRWMSRIVLELVEVRVQRLRDISEEDALAEGVARPADGSPARFAYADLWDSINGKRKLTWKGNPWVWVLTFRRVA